MSERIPARYRALGVWARCWQLTGGVWPPPSRAIAHQIMVMFRNLLMDASNGRFTLYQATTLAQETIGKLTRQKFYPGGEQDIAIDFLTEAILDAELAE